MNEIGMRYSFVLIVTYIFILLIYFGAKIGLAFIPANIAKKKGYGFGGFFILGLFFFIIGLIVALCLDNKNDQIHQMTNAFNTTDKIPDKIQPESVADELKKYNDLLTQGAITQDEYNLLKEKILNK